MNLIFLEQQTASVLLAYDDPRAVHVRTVLKPSIGDTLFVGVPQGPQGKARIESMTPEGLRLSIDWEVAIKDSLFPIHLLVGLPRPQTARKILQSVASLGIQSLTFFQGEKSERAYAQSTLWSTEEWQSHLYLGAQQACATTFPEVYHAKSLEIGLEASPKFYQRIALDLYEATVPLACAVQQPQQSICLAIGPERGWSNPERDLLRASGFILTDFGPRVLRVETACIAALGYLIQRSYS